MILGKGEDIIQEKEKIFGLMERQDKMEQTGIREKVLQEISELAQKYEIEQVILFGSRARGDYHRTSDIDLAVRGGNRTRFILDVDELTSTLLKYDIVDLDEPVDSSFMESIEKEGKIIYEKI